MKEVLVALTFLGFNLAPNAFALNTPTHIHKLDGGTLMVTKDFKIPKNERILRFVDGEPHYGPLRNSQQARCVLFFNREFNEDKLALAQDRKYQIKAKISRGRILESKFDLEGTKVVKTLECYSNYSSGPATIESAREAFGDYIQIDPPEQTYDGSL